MTVTYQINEYGGYYYCRHMEKGVAIDTMFSVNKYGDETALKHAKKLDKIITGKTIGYRATSFKGRISGFLSMKHRILKQYEMQKIFTKIESKK